MNEAVAEHMNMGVIIMAFMIFLRLLFVAISRRQLLFITPA